MYCENYSTHTFCFVFLDLKMRNNTLSDKGKFKVLGLSSTTPIREWEAKPPLLRQQII